MSDEPSDLAQDTPGHPQLPWRMTRLQRSASALLGLVAGGAGVAAVFNTENEVGSATLLAAGVYFILASFMRRFPRLKLGDNEMDPSELAEARKESSEAKSDSGEAKEGLGETLERLERLESAIARLGVAGERLPPVRRADKDDDVLSSGTSKPEATFGLDPRLAHLARQYNEVRWTMPSGRDRTSRMTRIMSSMIDLCQQVIVNDVDALLKGEDRGLRLLGVAYLNARPDPSRITHLVGAAVSEDKPFNEYWALQTIRKNLHGNCRQLTPDLRLKLQDRMNALPRGIDRWRLIQSILSDCP